MLTVRFGGRALGSFINKNYFNHSVPEALWLQADSHMLSGIKKQNRQLSCFMCNC